MGRLLTLLSHLETLSFSPIDLASLEYWLDASDASTVLSGGSPVSSGAIDQWSDKSASGYDMTQGNASLQMSTGVDTMNSLNVITSDNTSDEMSATVTSAAPSSATIFVVMNTNGDGNYIPFHSGATRYPIISQVGSSSTTLSTNSGTPTYRKNGVSISPTTRDDVYNEFDGADNILVIENADLSSWSTYEIGFYVGGFASNLDYAEIIILDNTATNSDKNQIGSYLGDRWGITWTDIT